MVAAAMADGHMDANEYSNIIGKASELGLDADEQRVIFDEIKQPMNVDQIAATASDMPTPTAHSDYLQDKGSSVTLA